MKRHTQDPADNVTMAVLTDAVVRTAHTEGVENVTGRASFHCVTQSGDICHNTVTTTMMIMMTTTRTIVMIT